MNKAEILVVGGAGYIGSHMVKMLAENGHKVTVFDNLSRGFRDSVISGELVEGDLCNPENLQGLFNGRSFDLVMHFAALAYVGESVEQPLLYYANNVTGTINLLQAMGRAGIDKLVFSSTCATYGEPLEIPITEDHPQNPINPYGAGKLMVEQIFADCAQTEGLKSVSLRYFNAAGCDPDGQIGERHNPETHLIPLVLREARLMAQGNSQPHGNLQVFGDDFDTHDGTCVRDYIHVNDLCAAHLRAAERLMAGKVEGDEAYNLGNGKGFSVLEVIEACRRVTGIEIPFRVVGSRAGDPAKLVGSSRKALEILSWQPEITDLDDIVRTAWDWFREHPQTEDS